MDYCLREAKSEDLSGVLAVYRDAGLESRGGLALDEAQAVFAKMKGYPNYKVYVAECDGLIVGTFALLVMDNLANSGRPSGIVEDVAVAKTYQGKGIGKAMMKYAGEECRRHGCYKMVLSSNERRTATHKFYESLGFSRHGFSFGMEFEQGSKERK